MAGMMDELMGALGGGGGLGDLLGEVTGSDASAASTEQAAGLGLEAILGGMAQNAQSRKGATALFDALDKHDGSALEDVKARFGSPSSSADGSKILGHVFGRNQDAVTQNIAQKSGLDVGAVAKMLPALAPIVMGMLGKKKAAGGLDAGGLAGMLKDESDGFNLGDIMGLLGGGGGLIGLLKKLLGR